MLLLQESPGDPALNAALLDACRTNLVFDTQCEPARAPFLLRLIRATGRAEAFAQAIAAGLAAEQPGGGRADFVQAYELLCLLAAEAPDADSNLLRTLLERAHPAAGRASCTEALVRLEGLPALVFALERFDGEGFPDSSELKSLLDVLRDRDGAVSTDAALARARSENSALARGLAAIEAEPVPPPPPASIDDYATVRRQLAAGALRFPALWWERASPADLAAAAADLLAETEDVRRLPYLKLFARTDFPLPPEPLLELVASPDRHVRYQAARLLGRLDHPAVHRLALDAFAERTTQWPLGLTLLGGSATDDDARLFGPLVDASPDEEELHRRCSDLLRIIGSGRVTAEAAAPLLLRIYEATPCSNCRGEAVRLLAAYGRLPARIADECAFDVDGQTAAVAAAADRGRDG